MQVWEVEESAQVCCAQNELLHSLGEDEEKKRSWSWNDHVEERKGVVAHKLLVVSLLMPSLFVSRLSWRLRCFAVRLSGHIGRRCAIGMRWA
jgi:hypothetical protein